MQKSEKKLLIIETLSLYLHITNSETNLITMKKQEIIATIIAEEKHLWKELQECIKKLGLYDPITDSATARWSAVHQLALKIVKK